MLPTLPEYIYQQLQAQVTALKTGLALVNTARERAEVAGGVVSTTVAALPLTNNTGGDLFFASDGLKPGETLGHGTGVMVYWNSATSQWLRVEDNLPPTTSTGGGPVSSVGLSMPSIFNVSGSPVTSAGTLTATLANESANTIFAGPTSGGAAAPTFRAMVAADVPTISPLTTKGDVFGFTTVNARLPVGSDNQFLVAASAQAIGLQYRGIVSADLTTALTTPPAIGGTTPAAAAFTTITGSGFADISGTLRAAGNTVPGSGTGVEVGTSGGSGYIFAINRGVAFVGLDMEGLTLSFNISTLGLATFGGNVKYQHSIGGTSAPSVAAGAGAGVGATASLVQGTDSSGIISLTTATPALFNKIQVTLTYHTTYASAPNVVFSPANEAAADFSDLYVNSAAGSFDLVNGSTGLLVASTTYKWAYRVEQ